MDWIVSAVSVIVISWTLVPLLKHDAWWIRVFDFPRVQIAVMTLVMLSAHTMLGLDSLLDWVLVLALGACLAHQITRILPYTRVHRRQVVDAHQLPERDRVSILVANVLTPNRRARDLLRIVESRDPDVLLLVETDEWWEEQLRGLSARYAHSVQRPQDNLYGMHLYSKLPLVDPQLKFLVDDGVPSIHAWLVLDSGHRVRIHAVHPTPPAPGENPRSAERDAELLVVARAVAETAQPTIVFGDLNDVAWSGTTRLFQKISGLLDPRIGRGMLSTFHAKYPFLRWPLDHIFFSADFSLVSLERLPAFGSDHFPIYAELCYAPAAEAVHEEPEADLKDRREAREKIAEVDVQDAPNRGASRPAGAAVATRSRRRARREVARAKTL